MRRAVLLSVGVHAALIAAFAGWHLTRPERVVEETRAPAGALVEWASIPTEIALVVLPDEPSGGDRGGATVAATSPHGSRIVVAPGTGGGTAPGTEPDRGAGSESMRMRGRRHDLRIPDAALARILAKEGTPYVPPTHARLEPNGGNGHVIRDAVANMRVARDGTVDIKDKPDFTIRIVVPLSREGWDELRRDIGKGIDAWLADPYRDKRPIPTDEIPRACMMHDDVCYTGDASAGGIGLIGGKLDITAALHRKFIGDPYASRKLALLDGTRAARVHVGAQHRAEQLDRSAEHARRNVELAMQTPDPVARRAALFALWDECIEGEGPAAAAGERARAIVIGTIRARLPAGSPDAFTTDEIARLDAARSSRQHFRPY